MGAVCLQGDSRCHRTALLDLVLDPGHGIAAVPVRYRRPGGGLYHSAFSKDRFIVKRDVSEVIVIFPFARGKVGAVFSIDPEGLDLGA